MDSEEETREAPSDSEEKNDEAARTAGLTDLKGPVVPVLWKLTISGNLPPNSVIAHVKSTSASRCGRSSVAKSSADDRRRRRGRRRGECGDAEQRRPDGFSDKGGDIGANSGRHVTETENRQQSMDLLEMKE